MHSRLGLIVKSATLICAMALGQAVMAQPEVSSQSVIPSQLEFHRIMTHYGQSLGEDLSHVFVRYNKFNKGGAVWAYRHEPTARCVIAVNPGAYGTGKVQSTLEGAPSLAAAKQFLVVHELSHCRFTPQMSKDNLALIGLKIESPELAQELMADLSALAYLHQQGLDLAQSTQWISRQRKGHFFSPRYNTGAHLSEKNVMALIEHQKKGSQSFVYYAKSAENQLIN